MAREIAIIALAYVLYGQVRNLVDGRVSTAEAFAVWILDLESRIGIDVELSVNQWVAAREPVAVAMNYYYSLLHFAVPVAVLVWLWRRHPHRYRPARSALAAGSLIGLLGFWLLPLAPPRLLPDLGYVDTFWYYDTWGSLSDPSLERFSNQYAAMPSLHVGWALWAGVVVAIVASRYWVRIAGLLYPVVTLVVVVATANHFLLDVVGSVVVMGAGAVLVLLWHPDCRSPLDYRSRVGLTVATLAVVAVLIVTMRPPYPS